LEGIYIFNILYVTASARFSVSFNVPEEFIFNFARAISFFNPCLLSVESRWRRYFKVSPLENLPRPSSRAARILNGAETASRIIFENFFLILFLLNR